MLVHGVFSRDACSLELRRQLLLQELPGDNDHKKEGFAEIRGWIDLYRKERPTSGVFVDGG